MILETIFLWTGGITLICGILILLFMSLDKLISSYFKNIGYFWRMMYVMLFIKDKEEWLNKRIYESNGKKYKIIEVKEEQKLKGDKE